MTKQTQHRLNTLYTFNSAGRLIGINEPASNQYLPRLVIMRTIESCIFSLRDDQPEELIPQIEALIEKEPTSQKLLQPLRHHQQYIALLEKITPIDVIRSGPAYIIPKTDHTPRSTRITAENRHLLQVPYTFSGDRLNFRSPICAIVEDESVVSLCFCARNTASATEAGAFTAEYARKQGYASIVVQDWANAIHASGRIPFYSTSADNIASQAVATKLNAIPFASDFSYR